MAPLYDVLLKNGHLIDPKNNVDSPADLAIKDGKIAAVGPQLPGTATREAEVAGLKRERDRLAHSMQAAAEYRALAAAQPPPNWRMP